jgi:hypothetical protein
MSRGMFLPTHGSHPVRTRRHVAIPGIGVLLVLVALPAPGLVATAGQAVGSPPAAPASTSGSAAPADDPCSGPGPFPGPVRVQIGTVEAIGTLGQDLLLPVRVKGVCDLARFSFSLTYDSRVIRLVRVEQTPFLAGDPPVEVGFIGLEKGAPSLLVQGARLPGTGGVDGIGTLARLVLRPHAVGDTDIRLVRLELKDAEGKVIPSEGHAVHVTVVATRDPAQVLRKGPKLPS